MEEVVFIANQREVIGKKVKALRRQGKLPAVLYGSRLSPLSIVLDYREANRSVTKVTSSQLIVVEIDGNRHNALVREKQRDPVIGKLLHVDFMAVSMTEKLRVKVLLELKGEPSATKDFGGVQVTGTEEIEVECLPKDLPERIIVDISILKQIGDSIHVRDITMPPNVQVLTNVDEMIVLVTAPAAEEVEAAPVIEAVEEPEVIERGKKEEEAAAAEEET